MRKTKKIIGGSILLFIFIIPSVALAQWSVEDLLGYGLPEGSVMEIIVNVMEWILGIFGFIGIIGFVVSGIMYIISAGNDDMMKKAKNGMIYSIIGIVVGLAGFVAIQAVDSMLDAGWM